MLNDFHIMVLAVLASQAGIFALLVVMARLEPARTDTTTARKVSRGPARPTFGNDR